MVGTELWTENPALVVPLAFRRVVTVWSMCRAGMGGYACWPDAGGLNDQSAWLMDAFSVLAAAQSEWEEAERRRRKR